MRLNSSLRPPEPTGEMPGGDGTTPRPEPANQRHRGRTIMRQMLIAAAIAAGLVALWAALLPIAA
jgi:hypothetical protein